MILGAGQLQLPLLERCRQLGLKTVVVSPCADDPGLVYADVYVPLDVKDKDGILAAAIEHHIDGITTDQTDLPTRTAAYVAEQVGLPGIGYDMGCLFTDKYRQREKCRSLGIPVPAYRLIQSVEDLQDFLAEYPTAVVKPTDSQASHGMTRVTIDANLSAAFNNALKYSQTGSVLAEQWLDGVEYPVDSYVIDNQCRLLAIGQYHPFSISDVFSSYNTVWPAQQPPDVLRLLEETNRQVVEGFGLPMGRTHGEYIISNGVCYLVEIGARGGGSFFSSDDIRYVSGFCTEDYLIHLALGLSVNELPLSTERHYCCSTLFFYLPEGTVESTDGLSEVMELPYVRRNNLHQIHIGMHTRPILDKGARYFTVVAADNYHQLNERIDTIRQLLQIAVVTKDEQRLSPIWQ